MYSEPPAKFASANGTRQKGDGMEHYEKDVEAARILARLWLTYGTQSPEAEGHAPDIQEEGWTQIQQPCEQPKKRTAQ